MAMPSGPSLSRCGHGGDGNDDASLPRCEHGGDGDGDALPAPLCRRRHLVCLLNFSLLYSLLTFFFSFSRPTGPTPHPPATTPCPLPPHLAVSLAMPPSPLTARSLTAMPPSPTHCRAAVALPLPSLPRCVGVASTSTPSHGGHGVLCCACTCVACADASFPHVVEDGGQRRGAGTVVTQMAARQGLVSRHTVILPFIRNACDYIDIVMDE